MKAAEFVDFATSLTKGRALAEVSLRTAINRAYYGLFHSAKEFAIKHYQYEPPSDHTISVHRHLRDCFYGRPDPSERAIGVYLEEAGKRRTNADYVIDGPCLDEVNTRLAVAKAKSVIETALNPPSPSAERRA